MPERAGGTRGGGCDGREAGHAEEAVRKQDEVGVGGGADAGHEAARQEAAEEGREAGLDLIESSDGPGLWPGPLACVVFPQPRRFTTLRIMALGTGPDPALVEREMSAAPLLASTPTAVVGALAKRGGVRRYRRSTYLFHQGDESPEVFFLLSGRIELSSLSSGGHRQLHTTIETPQFFGELGVLGEMPRTGDALALEESTVWAAHGEDFLAFLGEEPTVTRAILQALARQVQSHEAFVEDLLFLDLKGRVAKRLLQLVSPSLEELPPEGAVVPAVVTHADLASLCGGSRENVTRILSEFQRRGLLERDGRRFVLRKPSGLAKLAGL